MNKLTKTFLTISIAPLFLGAILLGAGFATGGIQAIQKITAPSKNTETFTNISDIKLDTYRRVHIQSGNVQKTTVSYYKKTNYLSNLLLSSKDKTLVIDEKENENIIRGVIEVLGYILNEKEHTTDFREVVITIPKDKPLESLDGWNASLELTNVTINNINFQTNYADIVNSTISKGTLSGGISVYDSTLKDMDINLTSDYSQFSDSTAENLNFVDKTYGINFTNSSLKNTNYSDGIPKEDIQGQDLSNSIYNHEIGYVKLENVTLIGDNNFMGYNLSMDIDLAPDKKTTLDIQSLNEDIQLDGAYKDIKKIKENAKTTISHTEKDAKGKLIILNNQGKISIK